jgi:hypothetical protein
VVVSSISPRSARDTESCRKESRAKRNKQEKDTHQSFNTNHPDLLARAGAVADEGDEDDDAGIEYAGYVLGLEAVRDGEDQLLVGDDTDGVPVLGADAVGVLVGLRTNKRMVSISRYDQI